MSRTATLAKEYLEIQKIKTLSEKQLTRRTKIQDLISLKYSELWGLKRYKNKNKKQRQRIETLTKEVTEFGEITGTLNSVGWGVWGY